LLCNQPVIRKQASKKPRTNIWYSSNTFDRGRREFRCRDRVASRRSKGGAGPFVCAISVCDIESAFTHGWLFVEVVGAR